MITPKYRTKKNGVPILSKKEIYAIAEDFVGDFQPAALVNPQPIDVEAFLELYLGMTPDFQYLSHNGIYLGMTVFNDTDKVPVYVPQMNCADYISAKAHTVIIDRRLIEDDRQEHRLRFTQAHEGGHGIFHDDYFHRDPNQLSFLESDTAPIIQCRTDMGSNQRRVDPKYWTDKESMEWQANAFSSAFLMPRPSVRKIFEIEGRTGGRRSQIAKTINSIVTECNVSSEAALYRLCDLGMVDQSEAPDYRPGSIYLDFPDFLD
jgi:Zn-dependent peptidase ImmA (M78 family)